ncbi:MAG: hypothetical protein R3C19_10095 [Planctomycetaceae bacterium]
MLEGPDGPEACSDLARLLSNPGALCGLADDIDDRLPDVWCSRLQEYGRRKLAAAGIDALPVMAKDASQPPQLPFSHHWRWKQRH